MGFDLGKFLTNAGTLGTTWMRDQRQGNKAEQEARDLIAANTQIARDLFERDYGQSEWEDVQLDPRLRAAQDDALQRMEGISREGFTRTDRDALNQAFMQSRREEQSQRGAALDAAARRGDASGGNALMSALMAQQGGANRAADFATDVGIAGRERALRGLEMYGQQAGQMQSQDVSLQGARASGLDSFNQWATGQRSADAALLMNATQGQAQDLSNYAANLQASPGADLALQAGLAYATGGTSLAAPAVANTVGVSGAKSNTVPQPGGQGPTQGAQQKAGGATGYAQQRGIQARRQQRQQPGRFGVGA